MSSDSDTDSSGDDCQVKQVRPQLPRSITPRQKAVNEQQFSAVSDSRKAKLNQLLLSLKPTLFSSPTSSVAKTTSGTASAKCHSTDDELLFCIDTATDTLNASEINNDSLSSHAKLSPTSSDARFPINVLGSSIDPGLSVDPYVNLKPLDGIERPSVAPAADISEILSKSIMSPEWNRKDRIGPCVIPAKAAKKQRKIERDRTAGNSWFNLPATEMTDERRRDLEAMQLRDSLDPKRHYKSNDRTVLPKYFQIGTVIESAADFYHSRIPKKQRRKTIVEELLAESRIVGFQKRKYAEVQETNAIRRKGSFRHGKRRPRL